MFDIGSTELLLIIIVAIVVIGPKDLPHALFKVGQVVGKAKGMARHFRTGLDAMMREAELAELEKKWAEENRRIMAESAALPSPDTSYQPDGPDIVDRPMAALPQAAPETGSGADNDAPAVLPSDSGQKGGASA